MHETRAGHWGKDRRVDIYVGRGSKWGNPFVPRGSSKRSKYPVIEVDDCLAAYEAHVRGNPELMAALPTLRGKTLGCWCVRADAPQPAAGEERCHAEVLVRMVEETIDA